MSTSADAKLPAIEHIKARKDGLDVLSDIYRYAELGFDAIEPDDLALFRWYGLYTQRAEASAASAVAGVRRGAAARRPPRAWRGRARRPPATSCCASSSRPGS